MPVPVLLVLGLYVTGMGASFPLAFAIYITCVISQGMSGALVIARVADPGFVLVDNLSVHVQILAQVLVLRDAGRHPLRRRRPGSCARAGDATDSSRSTNRLRAS